MENINPRTGRKYYYKDNPEAVKARDSKRMFVDGKEIKKKHPLYKAGRYVGFEDAAFKALPNYMNTNEGEIYIVTNPAWKGWIKVGMAVDAHDRAKSYQTSAPFRDYDLEYVLYTSSRKETETEIHKRLSDICERKNEWFNCSVELGKRIIDSVVGEENG